MISRFFPLIPLIVGSLPKASADGVGEIVRIPTPIEARCINAKTDELTVTLRRIITQKTSGFFTEDNRAGVTVIATLNSDGHPTAKNPSVSLIDIESAPEGQVLLPLEYSIASFLPLSSDSGKTFTKNMLLEVYLDKVREKNTFGKVLDTAGAILSKLPIPANPYVNAGSEILKFANDTITSETKDAGGRLFASIAIEFNDREEPDIQRCLRNGRQVTGAIAIIGAEGAAHTKPLPLGNLNNRYCWRYAFENTYEIQYAAKPAGGCEIVPAAAYNEVPNDYVMILISAATLPASPRDLFTTRGGPPEVPKRFQDLQESRRLCTAMKLAPAYCGVL